MRVLVTRPGKDGQDLANALSRIGLYPVLEPLLKIHNLKINNLNTNGVQAFLSTSGNGVSALINTNPNYNIPLFAVGDATAVTARLGGFKTVHSASGDVSDLANLVAEILEPSGGSLLHATSSAHNGSLKKKVGKYGFKYRKEIVYETEAAKSLSSETLDALKTGEIDAILLYSPRTAEVLIELIRKFRLVRACKNIAVVCLSQAVAKKIEPISWEEVRIATAPTQEALLSCLKNYFDMNNEKKEPSTISNLIQDDQNNSVTGPIEASKSRTFRTVLLTILIVAILFGGASASTNLWLPKVREFISFLNLENSNEKKLRFLAGRLKKLETESNLNIPRLEELEAERRRLQARLDTTLTRITGLENSINVAKKMISAVDTGTGTAAAKATLKDLVERLNRLESDRSTEFSKNNKQIGQLTNQLDQLKTKSPYIGNRTLNHQASAFLISIGHLRSAIRSGSPFSSEISSLSVFGSDANDILDNYLDLKSYVNIGIPNPIQLQESFLEIAGKIVQSDRLPEGDNLIDQTIARLSKSLKWRRTDVFQGSGVEAIVARTERALKNNNIEKAVRELDTLSGNVKPLVKQWLQSAKTRIDANKMLADLQARAISMLVTKE